MSSGFLVFALTVGCTNKDSGGEAVEHLDGVAVEANENNAMSVMKSVPRMRRRVVPAPGQFGSFSSG